MGSTNGNSHQSKHSIPTDILDDLCSRFIINLPAEDRGNLVRICFQIELAHWFYLDYYCTDESNRLHPCGIRQFAAHIFQHVPQLREHVSSLDAVLDNWREYKQTVPTYGAILICKMMKLLGSGILSPEKTKRKKHFAPSLLGRVIQTRTFKLQIEYLSHVLLVQSYWTKASWGFPKGKVNEGEEPWKCAVREVLEETGFDISKLVNKNDYIEAIIHEQIVRLYIIGHIPRETKFQPRTRNEIKACEWFAIADLPANKKDMTPKVKMGVSPNAFFMVLPFVKRMRRWVSERNPKVFTNSTRRTRHKSMGDIESTTTMGKNKKSISQGLQNEITEFQQMQTHPPYQERQEYQVQNSNVKFKNHNGHGSGTKTNANGNRKERKLAKRQLFTPQNTHSFNFSPVQKESTPVSEPKESKVDDYDSFFNFVAPSWANFKFDRRAILDCLT